MHRCSKSQMKWLSSLGVKPVDRDVCAALEMQFIQNILRRATAMLAVPRHRHCIQPVADAD